MIRGASEQMEHSSILGHGWHLRHLIPGANIAFADRPDEMKPANELGLQLWQPSAAQGSE